MRPGRLTRAWSTRRTIQIAGGLLVAAVVVALPAALAFITPEALGASGFVGDPSAAALHSLDQTLQGNGSNALKTSGPSRSGSAPRTGGELLTAGGAGYSALPCAAFALPRLTALRATRSDTNRTHIVRPSPIDQGTTLLL